MRPQIIKIFNRHGELIGSAESANAYTEQYFNFTCHKVVTTLYNVRLEIEALDEDDENFLLEGDREEYQFSFRIEIKQLMYPEGDGPPELINCFAHKYENMADIYGEVPEYILHRGNICFDKLDFYYLEEAENPYQSHIYYNIISTESFTSTTVNNITNYTVGSSSWNPWS